MTVPALTAVAGGLAWIPIRLAIGASWNTTVLGLSYVEWNRLEVIPLALLLGAMPLLGVAATSGVARIGAALAGVGLGGIRRRVSPPAPRPRLTHRVSAGHARRANRPLLIGESDE